jgi:hypothetical protein
MNEKDVVLAAKAVADGKTTSGPVEVAINYDDGLYWLEVLVGLAPDEQVGWQFNTGTGDSDEAVAIAEEMEVALKKFGVEVRG